MKYLTTAGKITVMLFAVLLIYGFVSILTKESRPTETISLKTEEPKSFVDEVEEFRYTLIKKLMP